MIYKFIRPLLFLATKKDPERAHNLVLSLGKKLQKSRIAKYLIRKKYSFSDPSLEQEHFGIKFPNPIGLAAGFDKNGEMIELLSCFGFGFIEIGSVTPGYRDGNPRPRMKRLAKERSALNYMGLNNMGADKVYEALAGCRFSVPVGINIAALGDYVYVYKKLQPAADFIVLNPSCPNICDNRAFEEPHNLRILLENITEHKKKPTLMKFSPREDRLEEKISICEEYGLDGFVLCNTEKATVRGFRGGMSGELLREKATDILAKARKYTKLPIIASGGISRPEHVEEKRKAGADMYQIYTGMIYEGPSLVSRLIKAFSYP